MERTKPLRDIRSLSEDDLVALTKELGQPAFRAKQLHEWIFDKNVCSFDDMTNLPKVFREKLAESYGFNIPVERAKQVSRDGSRKYLLQFSDGVSVETVGMPSKNKLAVCISSQAGCAMGCAFCATGMNGLTRSLTDQEMVDQVLHVSRDFGERVTSVVFMGQGEPFANFDNVVSALRKLNAPGGLEIGARHLTVSTCGVIPGIKRFAELPEQFTLAISLHSAVQSTRNKLMPGVKKHTLPAPPRSYSGLRREDRSPPHVRIRHDRRRKRQQPRDAGSHRLLSGHAMPRQLDPAKRCPRQPPQAVAHGEGRDPSAPSHHARRRDDHPQFSRQ